MQVLILSAGLGSCLVAGIFFAFSSFVMRALGQLPSQQGIAAMQAINVTVQNPLFFLVFLGTGAICLAIAFLTLEHGTGARLVYLPAACALYLFGTVLVTGAFNVPLNQRLASADSDAPNTGALWDQYLLRWTRWNHVRTAAAFAAAVLFALAWGA